MVASPIVMGYCWWGPVMESSRWGWALPLARWSGPYIGVHAVGHRFVDFIETGRGRIENWLEISPARRVVETREGGKKVWG